mmetsp:Transcript_16223/g.32866  ORF Transcript_16223/g.32866 Transcript_16223/m.32866 type:complete len:286 (+) Transcript_16223:44-901(+)
MFLMYCNRGLKYLKTSCAIFVYNFAYYYYYNVLFTPLKQERDSESMENLFFKLSCSVYCTFMLMSCIRHESRFGVTSSFHCFQPLGHVPVDAKTERVEICHALLIGVQPGQLEIGIDRRKLLAFREVLHLLQHLDGLPLAWIPSQRSPLSVEEKLFIIQRHEFAFRLRNGVLEGFAQKPPQVGGLGTIHILLVQNVKVFQSCRVHGRLDPLSKSFALLRLCESLVSWLEDDRYISRLPESSDKKAKVRHLHSLRVLSLDIHHDSQLLSKQLLEGIELSCNGHLNL